MSGLKTKMPKAQRSAQELIGIEEVSGSRVRVGQNTELLFFRVRPVNVAVLPAAAMEAKVMALANVLKTVPALEILCLNSSESFEDNKAYLLELIQREDNPAIRRLCEQDIQYLDGIQQETATAREFYVLLRTQEGRDLNGERQRLEKLLKEQGFEAEAAAQEDIRRALAVYYTQHPVEQTDGIDGERWVTNAVV